MLLIGFDQKFSIFREIVNFYSVPKSRKCISRSAKKCQVVRQNVAWSITILPEGRKCPCKKRS
jgi:hypothetical protein